MSDLIYLRWRRHQEFWLASFDVQKGFDSLPWWALFGVRDLVVRCFEAFYRNLQRCFRYGHVHGEPWQATNRLAQGCPVSPDLLNLPFEPFHR